jgi:hypothetical protein
LDAFLPAGAEILIVKRDSHGFCYGFADRFYHFVFLEFAVQQGCGEVIEPAMFGHQGR